MGISNAERRYQAIFDEKRIHDKMKLANEMARDRDTKKNHKRFYLQYEE